ncbi:hypothetical protein TREMEDRAFT_66335 [Tremella mesenterica DSM 1558]|uniref:uncharacterized protein n=1 Tax=Tremella mesenterica (strain ATCC 24925 / CBS 8224 / DSM 1558 / NBRC 9311 / NRRL Y-6157 / RJB 2259-6 / UBC 559-6) TaxID=578456 RepID=UPI00032D2281|nr:uncharacterized protein TREMEDRAFT_66335 [Tremella mesenterica DSM 1558]EIW65612.1 hypothetical protein TREMEDRAFT_66335 [Tremella mesenterica DSM 1558]
MTTPIQPGVTNPVAETDSHLRVVLVSNETLSSLGTSGLTYLTLPPSLTQVPHAFSKLRDIIKFASLKIDVDLSHCKRSRQALSVTTTMSNLLQWCDRLIELNTRGEEQAVSWYQALFGGTCRLGTSGPELDALGAYHKALAVAQYTMLKELLEVRQDKNVWDDKVKDLAAGMVEQLNIERTIVRYSTAVTAKIDLSEEMNQARLGHDEAVKKVNQSWGSDKWTSYSLSMLLENLGYPGCVNENQLLVIPRLDKEEAALDEVNLTKGAEDNIPAQEPAQLSAGDESSLISLGDGGSQPAPAEPKAHTSTGSTASYAEVVAKGSGSNVEPPAASSSSQSEFTSQNASNAHLNTPNDSDFTKVTRVRRGGWQGRGGPGGSAGSTGQ